MNEMKVYNYAGMQETEKRLRLGKAVLDERIANQITMAG